MLGSRANLVIENYLLQLFEESRNPFAVLNMVRSDSLLRWDLGQGQKLFFDVLELAGRAQRRVLGRNHDTLSTRAGAFALPHHQGALQKVHLVQQRAK